MYSIYCECKPVKIDTFYISFLIERIKYLTMTDAKKVWMPDTFFRNEKEGRFHNILVPNVYIRIFPNGDVLYSIRLVISLFLLYLQLIFLHSTVHKLYNYILFNFRVSLTLACPMNLKLYPLDRQKCSLRVASCKFKIIPFLRLLILGRIYNEIRYDFFTL